MDYIKKIKENFSNKPLTSHVNMATNSFVRLFKKETGISLQQFIKEGKIKTARGMFDHTDISIQEVAKRLNLC